MKTLMMTLALVTATGCTTVASTSAPVAKEPVAEQNSEEGLRQARQAALLEALGAK